jgi:catechol 2,3-dioxygenase-like lactoylglutathione lyase family enzyme
MKIKLNSVIVQNQEAALRFYTEVLGFVKKVDLPAGDFRWLTVVSPEEPDGAELLLEPNAHPAAAAFQKALFESVIPLTSFAVDDIEYEHRRLKELGVVFTQQPVQTGDTTVAIFEDTCGNLIQIYQVPGVEEDNTR